MTNTHADPQGPPDSALAVAASRGDDAAFATLYARYAPRIEGYLARLLGDRHLAEDVTHEVFVSALRRLRQDRPPIAFGPWLFRIARNAAIDEARRRRRTGSGSSIDMHPIDPIDRAPGPEAATLLHEDLRRLRSAFASLGDDQRDAIGLRYGAGLTAKEIGIVIDKREAAVQKLIERAIDRLREVMA